MTGKSYDGYARKVAFDAALAASMNGMTYENDTVTCVLAGMRGISLAQQTETTLPCKNIAKIP